MNNKKHLTKQQIFDLEFKYNNFGYKSYKNINWKFILTKCIVTEDFIREFEDVLNAKDWENISQHQTLSEEFIREFKDLLNWDYISYNQTLSEEFIIEFKDKVDWQYISIKQKVSTDFIDKYKVDNLYDPYIM